MNEHRNLVSAGSDGIRPADPFAAPRFVPFMDDAVEDGGLLGTVRRRWKVALTVFAAAAALLIGAMEMLPRSYRAVGQVAVTQDPLSSEPVQYSKVGDAADVESQVLMSDSSRLLEELAARPAVRSALSRECEAILSERLRMLLASAAPDGRTCRDDLAEVDANPARTVLAMSNRFETRVEGQSRVISISYTSPLPATAQTLVNALINVFIQDSLDTKRAPRLAAVAWLQHERARLVKEITAEEAEIDTYHRTHGMVNGQFAPIQQEELTQLARQLALAESAKAEAVARLRELEQAEASGQGVAASSGVLNSKAITDLKQELARVTATSSRLRYAPGTAAPFEQQRVDLQAMIEAEARRIAGSVRREAAAASERVDTLNARIADLEKAIGGQSQASLAIDGVVHEVAVKRELYLALSKRESELETERRLMAGNVQLVNYAVLPIRPWFPKTVPFGIASLAIAAGLAFLASILADKADGSVRSLARLEFRAGARVIACVPRIRRLSLRRILAGTGNYPALEEAVRALHAELALAPDGVPRRLLVTSAQAGDGKTMIAVALARFAASTGKRVLLVEADLRRPGFPKAGRRNQERGLLHVLRGEAEVAPLVDQTGIPGLSVLRAGGAAQDSTELLATHRFSEVLAAAGAYDAVIIDSPPASILVDARIISRQVDGVLFCARWGRSREASVASCIHDLERSSGNVVGIVANAVARGDHVRGYGGLGYAMMQYPALTRPQ